MHTDRMSQHNDRQTSPLPPCPLYFKDCCCVVISPGKGLSNKNDETMTCEIAVTSALCQERFPVITVS